MKEILKRQIQCRVDYILDKICDLIDSTLSHIKLRENERKSQEYCIVFSIFTFNILSMGNKRNEKIFLKNEIFF